jgi:hypothetical protein
MRERPGTNAERRVTSSDVAAAPENLDAESGIV